LTKKIYRAVPVLLNERTGENPWGVSFMAMLHMANDSHLFQNEAESGWGPLYEAKMLHQFTHRWATYEGVKKEELQKGLARSLTFDELNSPEYTLRPRYWVSNSEVEARLATKWNRKWLLAFRDITSSVVERTVIFSFLPRVAVGHTSPLLFLKNTTDPRLAMCFVASVNSLTLDYTARQKIGGTHLTFGLLNQLPVLSPTKFSEEDVAYLSERVLELVYTAYDMQPFAMDVWADMDEVSRARVLARWQDCNSVKLSEFKVQNDPPTPFSWNEERRAHIRAELDAHIARLYGLTRDELRYILDPTDVYGPNFPSETFRVLKEKEIRQFGEYRTRRLVLAAWDAKNDNLTR
jgi:hypothetical protein